MTLLNANSRQWHFSHFAIENAGAVGVRAIRENSRRGRSELIHCRLTFPSELILCLGYGAVSQDSVSDSV